MDIFDSIENDFDAGVLEKSRGIIESETEQPSKTVNSASFQKDSKNIDPYQPIDDVLNDSTDMTVIRAFASNTIKESNKPQCSGAQASTSGNCDLTTRYIVYKRMAEMVVEKRKVHMSVATSVIRTKISFSLVRSILRCICGSRSRSPITNNNLSDFHLADQAQIRRTE